MIPSRGWSRGFGTTLAIGAFLASFTSVGCDKSPLLAPTDSVITLSAGRTFLPTNSETEIVATIIEPAGTAVQNGTLISFATTLGSIDPRDARTRNGQVRVRFLSGSVSGQATITALSGSAALPEGAEPLTIRVGAGAAGRVSVSANPGVLPSTGGTSVITALVFDVGGNPLAGVPVSFAIQSDAGGGSGSTGSGTLSRTVVTTNQQGSAQTNLTTTVDTTVVASVGGETAEGEPSSVSATVTVRVNIAPSTSIAFSPAVPIEDQAVTFTLTPPANVTLRGVRINFGDGDSVSLGTISSATTVAHTYSSDGTFTVRVTGTSNSGESFSSVTEVVVSEVVAATPAPPPATIDAEPNPTAVVSP